MSTFFYLFRKSALGFIDFLDCIFILYSIYFCSNFYLLPSTNFNFIHFSFSSLLKAESQVIYLSLFLFLKASAYHYELPSWNCFCCIPQVLVCYISSFICLKVLFNFFLYFFFHSLILLSSMLFNLNIYEFSSFLCVITFKFHTTVVRKICLI